MLPGTVCSLFAQLPGGLLERLTLRHFRRVRYGIGFASGRLEECPVKMGSPPLQVTILAVSPAHADPSEKRDLQGDAQIRDPTRVEYRDICTRLNGFRGRKTVSNREIRRQNIQNPMN